MEKNIHSIWLIPEEKDKKYLDNIIHSLSSGFHAPSFLPHLTLIGDIRLESEELVQVTNQVFENVSVFEVEKNSLGQSNQFTKTVFIDIKLSEQLKSLFNEVSSKTDNRSIENFKPHMSLIYKHIPEKDRISILQGLDVKDKFQIGKVVVVDNKKKTEKEEDVKGWEILYEKELKSKVTL